MPGKHALLSPSSASRWSVCPASVVFQHLDKGRTSDAAEEGTRAHDAAEKMLLGRIKSTEYDVQMYLDFVASCRGELFVELKLPVGQLTGEPGAKGTADAVVVGKDSLHIIDLKYGKGVKVDAEYNKQLALYAMAAIEELGFALPVDLKVVRMVIVQPRLDHISQWILRPEELELFVNEQILAGGKRALVLSKDKSKCTPSDYSPGESSCRWCAGAAFCPALDDEVVEAIAAGIERPLHEKYAALPVVEQWAKAVRGEAYGHLMSGGELPGYKLVPGRNSRAWIDGAEKQLAELGIEGLYTDPALKSVAQVKKLTPKALKPKVDELVVTKTGSPVIVPANDKRGSVTMFEVLDES